MDDFYRFLRPQQFNISRNVIEASQYGGICLHARPLGGQLGGLFVGFSVCPSTELFNRNVAKKKADYYDWYVNPKSYSGEDIINELLANPIESAPMMAPILESEEYLWDQLREFNKAVESIRQSRKQARQFQQNHQDAVKALKLGERYNGLRS